MTVISSIVIVFVFIIYKGFALEDKYGHYLLPLVGKNKFKVKIKLGLRINLEERNELKKKREVRRI